MSATLCGAFAIFNQPEVVDRFIHFFRVGFLPIYPLFERLPRDSDTRLSASASVIACAHLRVMTHVSNRQFFGVASRASLV